jgi:uncharacterized protein with von Willebrand factor type A (vWA) domain
MEQEINTQLSQEFERFIEFGTLLDRATRKYLIQYLKQKLSLAENDLSPESLDTLKDSYFQYFRRALDDLFGIDGLLDTVNHSDKLAKQITLDTLYWLRKSYDKVRDRHPYQEEKQRLESWSVTPPKQVVQRWHFLTIFLRNTYNREQLDIDFYENRFKKTLDNTNSETISPEQFAQLDLFYTDLLSQWDALLHAKILEYELNKLDEEKQSYTQLMQSKVEEYKKLLQLVSPFAQYLGNYWDMSRQLWQQTSFDVIQQYNDILQNEQSVQALADLLGQMRAAEIEIEEETFERILIRQEWVVDDTAKAEVVGIHESNELQHIISAEASLLADVDTELLFLKKFADRQLLTLKYEEQQLVNSQHTLTEIHQKIKQKEKGPFIICVDTSESMTGRPEQIAKVLCLGILKMAATENRRAYLINFSMGIETLDLLNIGNSIDAIANFLRMSFYGGTDISLPLYEALRQLETNHFQDADVLVISDFIMYKVDEEVLKSVRYHQQNKGTKFHSLTLSNEPNPYILNFFDTNWVYDPQEKGIIRSLTHGLKTIQEG